MLEPKASLCLKVVGASFRYDQVYIKPQVTQLLSVQAFSLGNTLVFGVSASDYLICFSLFLSVLPLFSIIPFLHFFCRRNAESFPKVCFQSQSITKGLSHQDAPHPSLMHSAI